MGSKLLLAIATIVAVVAVGGIGFAEWTATATISGSSVNAGNIGPLSWSSPTNTEYGYAVCSNVVTSGVLTLTATNLGPNDYCTFTATLANAGSLGGTLSESISPNSCPSAVVYYDNVAGTIAPYPGTFSYSSGVYATAYFSGTCSFTVTVTASAT